MKQIFQEIRKDFIRRKLESCSGPGSSLASTMLIREKLQELIKKYQIDSILDLGCGDCNWISRIEFDGKYRGVDIIPEEIADNKEKFKKKDSWMFYCLDITNFSITKFDLIICRDVLIHLPEELTFFMLDRIFQSSCKYFLSTTFPKHNENKDIAPGKFYPINLQIPPFGLDEPLELINEGYARKQEFKDKSLGLWKIKNLTSSSQDVQDQEQP